MKIRIGFVSNSSSASFVVKLADITDEQLVGLMQTTYQYGESKYRGDGWNVWIFGNEVHASTTMDNGDMGEWMEILGVDKSKVVWESE